MVLTPKERAELLIKELLISYKTKQDIFNLYRIPDGADVDKFFSIMACHAAVNQVKLVLYELNQIVKPADTTFVVSEPMEISQTGEEKINYWKEVESIIRQHWSADMNIPFVQ